MKINDQLNRELSFFETPKRIISLVPSLTELLVDIGLQKQIIGITKFCVHPSDLKDKKIIVGGTKQVNVNKIKNLQPDIIICNKEENTKEIVKSLQNICPCYISDIVTINDSIDFIRDLGKIFSIEKKTQELINKIQLKLNHFELFIKKKSKKSVAYFIWRNPWIVVGSNTFINELLRLNKFENIFKNVERYPEINLSSLKNKDLDFVLLSSEPYPFKEKHIEEIKSFTNAKVVLVDGEFFSWYGSRLLKAFNYFKLLQESILKY